MKTAELTIHTGRRRGLHDLTAACEGFVAGEGDGLIVVFVPHATAGVVVVELGAGSDADLMAAMDRLPATTGGPTATVRSGMGRTTLSRSWPRRR